MHVFVAGSTVPKFIQMIEVVELVETVLNWVEGVDVTGLTLKNKYLDNTFK